MNTRMGIKMNVKNNFSSEPLEPLIVGIDPGTTTGIAVMGLNGNLIIIYSRKNFSRAKISRFLLYFGNPVIIAGDIKPMPRLLEKIAASFAARLAYPKIALRRKDKIFLAKEALRVLKDNDERNNFQYSNRHERDTLAAAFYAWNVIKTKMERVERKVNSLNLKNAKNLSTNELINYVKTDVLMGTRNIKESINDFLRNRN